MSDFNDRLRRLELGAKSLRREIDAGASSLDNALPDHIEWAVAWLRELLADSLDVYPGQ